MVIAGIVLQDVLDVGRIGQKESVIRAGFQMSDVAESVRSVEKRPDRIGTELRQNSEKWITARSRRICGCV